MKKLQVLLSTITICLLLLLSSCSKQDTLMPRAYIKTAAQGFVDTPYLKPKIVSTVVADTPYLKTIVVLSVVADTPYLHNNIKVK